jgi:cell division protein FtsW (lipid II flippase)
MTTEDRERLTKAYKRAGFGLAIAALIWTVALLIRWSPDDGKAVWLIPIFVAALSVLCFSRYRNLR